LPTHHPRACTHTSVRVITFPSASPHRSNTTQWYGNINPSSIGYAFQPRLRVRLTLGGFTVPRKPWVFGEQDSHLLYRYSSRHNHFHSAQPSFPSTFTRVERSPTPTQVQHTCMSRSFGCALEPRSFLAQSLSTTDLIAHSLTPRIRRTVFGVWLGRVQRTAPIPFSISTPARYYLRLARKLFRGEPDICEFD